MLTLLADENFNGAILRGLLRRLPDIDLLTVQRAGLSGAEDPQVLELAARLGRVLLTHDVRTIPEFAYERIAAGKPMPGVIEVPAELSIGAVIQDLILLAECSLPGEWEGHIVRLPL